MGLFGVHRLEGDGSVNTQLVTGGKPGGLEVKGGAVSIESDQGVTIGSPVRHGRVRYAAIVLGPFPPTSGNRYVDDVVVWFFLACQ